MEAVCSWLTQVGLEQYVEPLEKAGYDELELLRGLNEAELAALVAAAGMPPGHALKLKRKLLSQPPGVAAGIAATVPEALPPNHVRAVAAVDAASGSSTAAASAETDMRVVEISVGGRVFAAASSTWARFPGSLLAGLVDEKWRGQVLRDAAGRIFIDRSPALFHHVLAFLRSPTEPIDIAEDDEPAFKRELMYYGLDALVYSADELRSPVFWHAVDLHSDEPFDVNCEYSILVCEALTCRACERTQEGVTHRQHVATQITLNGHGYEDPKDINSGWDRQATGFASKEYFEERLATCCSTCVVSRDSRLKRYAATAVAASELHFGGRWGYNGVEPYQVYNSTRQGPPREDLEEGAGTRADGRNEQRVRNRPKTLLQRTLPCGDKRWLRNAHNQCTHYQPNGVDAALVHSLMCRPVGLIVRDNQIKD